MNRILYCILIIIAIPFENYGQSLNTLQQKGKYDDFANLLAAVVYNASSLYQTKQFQLQEVSNVFTDIPELAASTHASFIQKNASKIECKENTTGYIDVFWSDTLLMEVRSPFSCGEKILLRDFWPEHPELLRVYPTLKVFAFNENNQRVNVDTTAERRFYLKLREVYENKQNDTTMEIDKSYFFKNKVHKHLGHYDKASFTFGLLCNCNASFSTEDEALIRAICCDFCKSYNYNRISFELFSWHNKPISDFHEMLLSHFPLLNLPLIMTDGYIESQKCLRYINDLGLDLTHEYFNNISDSTIENETLEPVGFYRMNNNVFVTIIRRLSHKDIAIQTFNNSGVKISCVFFHDEKRENNLIIRSDGHILLTKEDYFEYSYTISPNGVIAPFRK